ncbi:hypothetical protein BS47DRAFT_1344594, partial [Hydnum rufescens UP504]
MRKTAQPSQSWLQRLFSHFRPHRSTVPRENAIVGPISASAIASAESVLRWISKVPGGHTAQVRIGVALDTIKGLNVESAHDTHTHDVKTLRWLEFHIRYLVELLEPFAMMHGDQISPLLQSQVLMLSRELATVSSKMAPAASSKEAPRRHFFHPKRREERGGNPPDIRAFTLDFKLALDQFRRNALPLYPISPIEAALLPLGVISKSSCALSPFIQWILKSESIMEYRIGNVRTVRWYYRWSPRPRTSSGNYRFMVVGLENRCHIENWLKIDLSRPNMEGTVTFGTTPDTLNEGLPADRSLRLPDDTLPVTHFAQKIHDACERYDHPVCSRLFLSALHVTDNGENTACTISP